MDFDSRVSMTIFESSGVLSKTYKLNSEGGVIKTAAAQMVRGAARRIEIDFSEFGKVLSNAGTKTAFAYGVHATTFPDTVSITLSGKENETTNRISRTQKYFRYSEGPGILMNDHDPCKDGPTVSPEELSKILTAICPSFGSAARLSRGSLSSGVHRKGETPKPGSGFHLYTPVKNASDIPRFGATLFKRLWLQGFGYISVSSAGSFLVRSILDSAVYSPERLDFVGKPIVGEGLEWTPPQATYILGGYLDTSSLADLTPEEETRFQELVLEAKAARESERVAARSEWAESQVKRMVLKGANEEKARSAVKLIETGGASFKLPNEFVLDFSNGESITINEVLKNPSVYSGKTLADPFEGPAYGRTTAKFYANTDSGSPIIYSHAHGGAKYFLKEETRQETKKKKNSKNQKEGVDIDNTQNVVRLEAGELPQIINTLLDIVRRDGTLFEKGGELVRLSRGHVYTVTAEWLQIYLSSIAKFVKFDQRSQSYEPRDCTKDLAKNLLAMAGLWGLPHLNGISTVPTITPAGHILDKNGFDAGTGLFMALGSMEGRQGIPDEPTDEAAKKALECLWKPFSDFTFESSVDRGGYLAALLTVIVRPLLPTAPGFIVSSPMAGSGKTLLAKSLAALAGVDPEIVPYTDDENELRKRLLSLARISTPVIIIDNVSGTFQSDSLCGFLTSDRMTDRILGVSQMLSVRTNALVIITGNNPIIAGDLNRRLLRARINPACEKPFLRTFNIDPVEYVKFHCIEMVQAAITILKASVNNTFKHTGGRLASFEMWSDFVRNAVAWVCEKSWLDVEDPVKSIEESYETDPDTQRLSDLLREWENALGDTEATVLKAIQLAKSGQYPDLYNALMAVGADRGDINARLLGWWLRKHESHIVNGLQFKRCGTRQHLVSWKVSFCSNCSLFQTPVGISHVNKYNNTIAHNAICIEELEKTLKTTETHVEDDESEVF